jgi:hypothetical protein
MSQEKRTRKDLEQAIIKKAIMDATFRKELLASPKTALETVLSEEKPGSRLPANLDVKAFQEPENALYFVIPHVPSELSDAQLDHVAGGVVDADQVKVSVEWSR